MNPSPSELESAADLSIALDHLSLLSVTGADARTFLDSQLTRDVPLAGAPASLAGYCSPKGRLLAIFTIWSEGDTTRMLLSRDIADAIAKRLRMYVLRAKVVIADVTATHAIEGLESAGPLAALTPWEVAQHDGATWIRQPDANQPPRCIRIAEVRSAAASDAALETWRWSDIRAGIPRIVVATQDRFVPQMVNLEALGGVDFKKGCFPGQEVVARSQYLGKLKRRTTVGTLDGDAPLPAPGVDVNASGDGSPIGLVVDAARGPDGRQAVLVELPLASFEATDLAIEGRALILERPPYPLPDNEVFVRPKL